MTRNDRADANKNFAWLQHFFYSQARQCLATRILAPIIGALVDHAELDSRSHRPDAASAFAAQRVIGPANAVVSGHAARRVGMPACSRIVRAIFPARTQRNALDDRVIAYQPCDAPSLDAHLLQPFSAHYPTNQSAACHPNRRRLSARRARAAFRVHGGGLRGPLP